MQIKVNGSLQVVAGPTVAHDDVVAFAFPGASDPSVYVAKYRNPDMTVGSLLVSADSVSVQDGMQFYVVKPVG